MYSPPNLTHEKLKRARALADKNPQLAHALFIEAARERNEDLYKATSQNERDLIKYDIQSILQEARALRESYSKLAKGRRVVAEQRDSNFSIEDYLIAEKPNVSFKDIIGLEDIKEQIYAMVIYPYQFPDKAEACGIQPGGSALFYGPPGTGKTMLAKAIASEVDAYFMNIKVGKVMSKWVGDAEKNIAAIFEAARYRVKEEDKKVVLLMDEIDGLTPKRSSTNSSVMPRVVTQLNNELDGIGSDNTGILILGATNEPQSIDYAILRRFKKKIYVGPPDAKARETLLRKGLKIYKYGLEESFDYSKLVDETEGFSADAIVNAICARAREIGFIKSVKLQTKYVLTMEDVFQAIEENIHTKITQKQIEKYGRFAAGKY